MVFIQFRKSLASALGHWPVMISWPVASASQHEDPIVYKRDSTKEYIMAYFKMVGGNTKSAIGLAKTKGVDRQNKKKKSRYFFTIRLLELLSPRRDRTLVIELRVTLQ